MSDSGPSAGSENAETNVVREQDEERDPREFLVSATVTGGKPAGTRQEE